jgi:hypothetical protein
MGIPTHFTIKCQQPLPQHARIPVIKAIRYLTGIGLREAKEASESDKKTTYAISPYYISNHLSPMTEILSNFAILKQNNVEVFCVADLLDKMRSFAKDALDLGEDELGNEILQLILAEKLRRGI